MDRWFDAAKRVSHLDVEICFVLPDELDFGSWRPLDIFKFGQGDTLPVLAIPRKCPSALTTTEAVGHEEKLAVYYQGVANLARKHDQTWNSVSHYFWLRLRVTNEAEQIYISFPWYDTLSEFESFFEAVSGGGFGPVFSDADQGWELDVYAEDELLFLRQRELETEQVLVSVGVPRRGVIDQIQPLRERAIEIIQILAATVGRDVWSRHVAANEFTLPVSVLLPSPKPWWQLW